MLVLDANILIRAVPGSKVRRLLTEYSGKVLFLAPDSVLDEAREHLPAILEKRGIPPGPALERCRTSPRWSNLWIAIHGRSMNPRPGPESAPAPTDQTAEGAAIARGNTACASGVLNPRPRAAISMSASWHRASKVCNSESFPTT